MFCVIDFDMCIENMFFCYYWNLKVVKIDLFQVVTGDRGLRTRRLGATLWNICCHVLYCAWLYDLCLLPLEIQGEALCKLFYENKLLGFALSNLKM